MRRTVAWASVRECPLKKEPGSAGAAMSLRWFVSLLLRAYPSRVRCGRSRPRRKEREVTRYLISFDDGAMTFPEEDLPDVAEAAHAVTRDAQDAGVWVFAGGLHPIEEVSLVATDGTVTDGPESKAYIGGLTIVDVPSREQALEWAAKFAVACRCAQEVREFLSDPAVGN